MSESQGYADAHRGSADPNQKSCRTCGATVDAGATTKHDEWHQQLAAQQQAVALDVVTQAFDQVSQRMRYNP